MTETAKILLVEDDVGLQTQMQWALDPYRVVVAGSRTEAIKNFDPAEVSVAIIDLGLPPDPDGTSEGLAVLDELLQINQNLKVIVVSGNSETSAPVAAVAKGAFDFIAKPVDIDVLRIVTQRALRVHALELENRSLRNSSNAPMAGIVFSSSAMERVAKTVERVARTRASVLIIGESGTGKELIASAVHTSSERKDGRLVAINCASIPENLLESELFGHERGAFTGAVKQTIGKFELANKGTLFLDEIGDMPLALQAKLLRFLQSKQFERVGGRTTLSVDVRIVSATNKPLETLIQTGQFREDLYYRLNEIRIDLPPLRDREGDAVLLAQHFCGLYARENDRRLKGISNDGLNAIQAYNWPGNVRELENRIKRAVIMTEGPWVIPEDLQLSGTATRNLNIRDHVRQIEGALLREAIALTEGNVTKVAKLLGISRPQVYTLMDAHNVRAQTEE